MLSRAHVIALLVTSAALAGCTGEPQEAGPENEPLDERPDEPATPEESPETQPSDVVIRDFRFLPPVFSVAAGTEVTWVNDDSVAHTVTDHNGTFDSGPLEQGQAFTLTFDEPGTYAYVCTIHPQMHGELRVQ